MDYLKRNPGTVALILFALGGFLAELATALPEGAGTHLTSLSLIALAAARGAVAIAETLKSDKADS